MALKPLPPTICSECDAADAKIIFIFTREHYCGAACHTEGYAKFVRMIARAKAEGLDRGEQVS